MMIKSVSWDVKTACYLAVQRYPGGVAAVAATFGLNPNTLQHKLNPHCSTHRLSADDVENILALTRAPEILDALTSKVGVIWIDTTKLEGLPADNSMLEHMMDLVKRVGAQTSAVEKSLADGVVTRAESRELELATHELLRAAYCVFERTKQFMPESEHV